MSKTRACPKCGFNSPSEIECLRCGIIFESFINLGIQGVESAELIQQQNDPVAVEEPDVVAPVFFNYKVNVWSLPLGLIGAFLLQKFWVFHYLVFLFCVIPVHEMGHAFAAWMNGRFALPIGAIVPTAGMTIIGYSYNFLITLIFFGVFGYLAFKAYQQKLYFWTAVSCGLILASIGMMTSLKTDQVGPFISYGGIAGEFLISMVLIISFYQPTFKMLRWDFFRYPFFVMGCMAFVNACSMWLRIQSKLESLPFGTAVSADGAGDSNGDMNRLVQAGWSESLIISKYLSLGKIAFTLILIQYIYSVVNSRAEKKRKIQSESENETH